MTTINDLFPEKGRVILTGGGKEFVEKLGVETARQVILGVLRGQNLRTQTEPLTRRRVVLATGAVVAMFAHGWQSVDNFSNEIPKIAAEQLQSAKSANKAIVWPTNWLIGLTGKGYQNVLRSNPDALDQYLVEFEKAIKEASARCAADFGDLTMTLGFVEADGQVVKSLSWEDITRLTTAIGSATLTIRGSEKATYGKLFERLILGSVLTILGFDHIGKASDRKIDKVFWLSDSSDVRECDATIRLKAGKLARFDIGFIGKGNPEIMKDKLTRFASKVELDGVEHSSQTFIIVDRMPATRKTIASAEQSGTEIIQMSMQYWPQELARRLQARLAHNSEILTVAEDELDSYLENKMKAIPILDYLSGAEIDVNDTDFTATGNDDEQLELPAAAQDE